MWVLMCMIEMLVCHVSMTRLSPVWYLWFWLAMVANYCDYFVFRRWACSFGDLGLDCGTATQLLRVLFGPMPIRALLFASLHFPMDPMGPSCWAFVLMSMGRFYHLNWTLNRLNPLNRLCIWILYPEKKIIFTNVFLRKLEVMWIWNLQFGSKYSALAYWIVYV